MGWFKGWDADEHPLLVFLRGWEGYQSDDLITGRDGGCQSQLSRPA